MQKKNLLNALIYIVAFVVWFVGMQFGLIGTAVSALCVGFVCFWMWRNHRSRNLELSGGLAAYGGNWETLSEKMITRIIILEALNRRTGEQSCLIAKKTLKLRLIYTVCFAALNALVVHTTYYQKRSVVICTLLTLVYAFLFLRSDTVSVIHRAAVSSPDEPIDKLTRDMTFDDVQTPKSKKSIAVGVLAVAVPLALVLALHWQPQWKFVPAAEGCCVANYRPGILLQGRVQIPDQVDGKPVVAIGENAFKGNEQVTQVTMPDTVVTIGKKAFQGCTNLRRIDLSRGLTQIDSGAFKNCIALASVALPESLETLNAEAFQNCEALKEIVIPKGVTEIRGNTFQNCSDLETVTLHDGIVDIHAYAFEGCIALREIRLPSGITEIHAYTFENCSSLKKIEIPLGVTRIAAHAFANCSTLWDVYIPYTVKEIGSSAFRNCGQLKTVSVSTDTEINERAFKESPTRIRRNRFTPQQNEMIGKELDEKNMDVVYFVYNLEKGPDVIYSRFNDGYVLISDTPKITNYLNDSAGIQPMYDYAQVLEYLQTAKSAGMTHVEFGMFSQTASDLTKETYIVSVKYEIDQLIAITQGKLAEKDHE